VSIEGVPGTNYTHRHRLDEAGADTGASWTVGVSISISVI